MGTSQVLSDFRSSSLLRTHLDNFNAITHSVSQVGNSITLNNRKRVLLGRTVSVTKRTVQKSVTFAPSGIPPGRDEEDPFVPANEQIIK